MKSRSIRPRSTSRKKAKMSVVAPSSRGKTLTMKNRARSLIPAAKVAVTAKTAGLKRRRESSSLIQFPMNPQKYLISKFNEYFPGSGEIDVEFNAICDNIHDFADGSRKGLEKEQFNYNENLNLCISKNPILAPFRNLQDILVKISANVNSIEEDTIQYFQRKYPLHFNSNGVDNQIRLINYSQILTPGFDISLYYGEPVLFKNDKVSKDETGENFRLLTREEYKKIGTSILSHIFSGEANESDIGISFDGNPGEAYYLFEGHGDDNSKPYVYQVLTPQNIVDSANTGFTIFFDKRDENYSRTEFIFPNWELSDSKSYFTANNLSAKLGWQLFIEKNGFSSESKYGFIINSRKSDGPVISTEMKIGERDGPSLGLLKDFMIRKCWNRVDKRKCLDIRSPYQQNQMGMVELLETISDQAEFNDLCFDLKRCGDHEQAGAIYSIIRRPDDSRQFIINSAGDKLSAHISTCYKNPTCYTGSPYSFLSIPGAIGVKNEDMIINEKIRALTGILNRIVINVEQLVDLLGSKEIITSLKKNLIKSLEIDPINIYIQIRDKTKLAIGFRKIIDINRIAAKFILIRAFDILYFIQTLEENLKGIESQLTSMVSTNRDMLSKLEVILNERGENTSLEIQSFFTNLLNIVRNGPNGVIKRKLADFYDENSAELKSLSSIKIFDLLNKYNTSNGFKFISSQMFRIKDKERITLVQKIPEFDFDYMESIHPILAEMYIFTQKNTAKTLDNQALASKINEYYKSLFIPRIKFLISGEASGSIINFSSMEIYKNLFEITNLESFEANLDRLFNFIKNETQNIINKENVIEEDNFIDADNLLGGGGGGSGENNRSNAIGSVETISTLSPIEITENYRTQFQTETLQIYGTIAKFIQLIKEFDSELIKKASENSIQGGVSYCDSGPPPDTQKLKEISAMNQVAAIFKRMASYTYENMIGISNEHKIETLRAIFCLGCADLEIEIAPSGDEEYEEFKINLIKIDDIMESDKEKHIITFFYTLYIDLFLSETRISDMTRVKYGLNKKGKYIDCSNIVQIMRKLISDSEVSGIFNARPNTRKTKKSRRRKSILKGVITRRNKL